MRKFITLFILMLSIASFIQAQCPSGTVASNTWQTPTKVFATPLSAWNVTYGFQSKISTSSSQVWYRVDMQNKGTLKVDLTNLPKDYDFEVYSSAGLGSANFLGGSYNTGTANETFSKYYSLNVADYWLVKVYPKSSTQFSNSSCFTITFTWTYDVCSALTGITPTLSSPGSYTSPGPVLSNLTPLLNWIAVAGSTYYKVYIRDLATGILTTYTSNTNSFTVPFGTLSYNKLMRWDIQAFNAAGCMTSVAQHLFFRTPAPPCSNTTSLQNSVICSDQLPFSWNGSRTATGTYTFTTTNSQGCDSVATLNLTVNDVPSMPVINVDSSTYCPNQQVQINANTIANVNSYSWSVASGNANILSGNGSPSIMLDIPTSVGNINLELRAISNQGCNSPVATASLVVGCALPVVLNYFDANKKDNSVLLKWQSLTEINSRAFEIEKSINGIDFIKIGSISAKGVSSTYEFVDARPSEVNYYRLKMIDKDGKFEYSAVKKVVFEKIQNASLYPNPCTSEIILKVNDEFEKIVITDFTGKTFITKDFKQLINTTKIDVSSLKNGNYVMTVVCKTGIKNIKFVKQ